MIISLLYLHLHTAFTEGKRRAPTLYLQADNCYKENKNRFVIFFCAFLIAIGWFDEIYMSFLPTGHTHEDIDRLFSYLRIVMNSAEFNTLMAIIKAGMPKAYKSNVRPRNVLQPLLFDWKTWMSPFMTTFEGHSQPHVFQFRKSSTTPQVY